MNWQRGRLRVVQEQGGEVKAQYGKYVIRLASEALTKDFGKGFSESNIKSFRKFYIEFIDSPIGQTLSAESVTQIQQTLPKALAWSHYERLMRVENLEARAWYIKEAEAGMWGRRRRRRQPNYRYRALRRDRPSHRSLFHSQGQRADFRIEIPTCTSNSRGIAERDKPTDRIDSHPIGI